MNDVVLSVENLHVHYGSIHAVKGISLRVKKGQIVTLIGANGAGKSTTLKAIMNLVKKSSGRVIFNGNDISKLPTHEIVLAGISLVPEGRRIFPNLTVYENLMMAAYSRKNKNEIDKDLDFVFSLFPRLKERLKQPGGTLSGGEQQMLALARGLMSRPKLLMLDEPSLGLAPLLVKEVFEVIKKIRQEGVTVLLIEQNALGALRIADYGYVLETGRIVLEDEAAKLLNNEGVKKAYLGIA
ncbi:ABC transporter ATP-binding protein [Thermotoga sp. Ku-13t]|uniref:ABC transporter ATP-binding protein n=1 Tax=Thermotoga sp. Ku-13t TaxID=1755813 RepID=UPI0013EA8C27|nr:ABC transporter ATP-binding protein [Thermotoga sp. Ku-13t]KAF2958226.1 ABC transporter ATP-binding protein [Thermotoga sp. Ku-13t]